MFNREVIRHFGEYIAFNQALTTALVNGNGTNGANPHTVYSMNGQFGVTVSAAQGATVTIPAGGNITVQATSDNGSVETLKYVNSGTTPEVFTETQGIVAFIFSPEMRGEVTVAISSTGTGSVDINPSYRTAQ